MFKFAYNTLVYWGEPIEKSIERLAKFGYDGVEFVGEPSMYDTQILRQLLERFGLEAAGICSIYTLERDLASPKEEVRKNALMYLKSVIKMASELGTGVVVDVVPSACMKTVSEAPRNKEIEWVVPAIQEAADYAAELGVRLAIEAWNRYETYFLNRCEQVLDLVHRINRPNVGVWLDTFHMNIEESSIPDAIRLAGKELFYLHIADSNRAAPGRGHIDFKPIIEALKDIGYTGYLSMELLPAAADPFSVLKAGGAEEFYDQYTKESIRYLKSLL
ncbi:sugar phosphate isomerase/epimerase [Thermatribacter velox]|uniref:Sugar phosphate isomerase/epimerase n=1 Tax=Thermatribacter velox TaxID=3039681 RepID=A0ABZ2YEE8_9BACT